MGRSPLAPLVDVFFPAQCLSGEKMHTPGQDVLCDLCRSAIDPVKSPLCLRCGRPFFTPGDEDHLCGACINNPPRFDAARALGAYGGVLLELIHLFKYHHRAHLHGILVELLIENECAGFLPGDFDVIVPVPLHRKRLYERGYNQSLLLARGIERAWGIPINDRDFVRKRWTEPQIKLSFKERALNVEGAFAIKGDVFSGRRVFLVDDVFTTGATASECAGALKSAGASHVGVLTIARVVIK